MKTLFNCSLSFYLLDEKKSSKIDKDNVQIKTDTSSHGSDELIPGNSALNLASNKFNGIISWFVHEEFIRILVWINY